jgi:hypothetical protein
MAEPHLPEGCAGGVEAEPAEARGDKKSRISISDILLLEPRTLA